MINQPQFRSLDQTLIRALPYPLYIVDRNSVVREANPRAVELNKKLGLGNVLPEEIRTQVDDAIVQNQELVGDDHRRAVRLSRDQTCLPQIFRLPGIFDQQEGWAVLLLDVTRMGENLETKAKTLSALSHDVRTPLTGIRMSLHLLLEEKIGPLNPNQRELLEVGRDECERMLTAVQVTLKATRLESGS